jgi:transglutaminase-like putative cysteine protease
VTLYRVLHETVYEYAEPVVTSHNEAHLLPRNLGHQTLHQLELRVDPTPATVAWHRDYFANDVVFLALEEPHRRLAIRAESRVEVRPRQAPQARLSPPWEEAASRVRLERSEPWLEAFEFAFESPFVPVSEALAAYARASFPPGRRLLEGLLDLNHRIHAEFEYEPGATTVATPVHDVLRERRGVCQDFAHLMLGCLRSLGLPGRYVSGYLRSRGDAGAADAATPCAAGDAEAELVGAEASHAWVSAFCPGNGWLDLDPTNDVVPAERHVVLAFGRDYDDVSPVKGVTVGGGAHIVKVRVEVRPEAESS